MYLYKEFCKASHGNMVAHDLATYILWYEDASRNWYSCFGCCLVSYSFKVWNITISRYMILNMKCVFTVDILIAILFYLPKVIRLKFGRKESNKHININWINLLNSMLICSILESITHDMKPLKWLALTSKMTISHEL